MEISVVTTIPHPQQDVWLAMRDHMHELAPYLPNVDGIEVKERTEPAPGQVKMVNLWKAAKTEIPTVARPFIDPSKMNWLDYATWYEDKQFCEWNLQVGLMPERVKCRGTTSFRALDAGRTEVKILGNLDLELKGLLPGLIAKSATPKVEQFVIKLVQPNFEKTSDAVTRYLDAQKKA
jgi:hypothetical protein